MAQIEAWINEYGALFYVLTFVWTALEGETFVIFAGFFAHMGLLDPVLLVLCAWTGSFFGDQVYFFLGRRYGQRLLDRFPRWRPGTVRALEMLKKYDVWFILSFRFIYGVRNVASFTMGMSSLTWARYSFFNCIAAFTWAVSFVSVGYFFGAAFKEALGEYATRAGVALLTIFLVVMWWLVTAPTRRAKREAAAAEKAQAAELPGASAPAAKAD